MSEKKVETIYLGKRLNGDRLAQLFRKKGSRKDLFWSGIKYVTIGESYYASQNGERLQMPVRPQPIESVKADRDRTKRWEVEEAVALNEYQRRKVVEKINREPRFLEDIPNLVKFVEGLTFIERKEFIEWLCFKIINYRLKGGNRK